MASQSVHVADAVAPGGSVIRRARLRAGVTQVELAHRLSTSQSLIARWERGVVEPGFATVVRAVRACGFELEFRVATYDQDHDRLVDENLHRSPGQRLRHMSRFGAELKRLQKEVR